MILQHLTSYPVANDLITTYKNNSLGRKSLDVANSTYDNFAKPFLPYLKGPWSWVAPYVAKADSLADSGLGHVDSHFPIVKEDTEKIKGTVMDYVYFPVHVAVRGRDYVFQTYNDEHGKMRGQDGLGKTAKSVVSTELRVAGDVCTAISQFVNGKKQTAKQKTELTKARIEQQIDEIKQNAQSRKEK